MDQQKIKKETEPGQGYRREQYKLAATLVFASFFGLFIIAIAIIIINNLK